MSAWLVGPAYGAVLAFALTMRTHHRRVFGRDTGWPGRSMCLVSGYAMLLGALGVATVQHGAAGGLVAWVGAVTVSGFALTLLLALAPRWVAVPGLVALVCGGLAWL